jgi:hypothetical protein
MAFSRPRGCMILCDSLFCYDGIGVFDIIVQERIYYIAAINARLPRTSNLSQPKTCLTIVMTSLLPFFAINRLLT